MSVFSGSRGDLWYEAAGSGPMLVLVHGNAASSRWWDLAWPDLTQSWTTYRIDLRGFGQSSKPEDGYSVESLADDLAEWRRALGMEGAVWVGHSLGGAVVMQLALDDPEAVRQLVLIDPAPLDGMPLDDATYAATRERAAHRDRVREALVAISPAADHGDFFERLVDDAMNDRGWIPMVNALRTWDIQDRMRGFSQPVTILHGALDRLVPIERLAPFLSWIPDLRLVRIPDVGHCLPIENAERCIQELARVGGQLIRRGWNDAEA